MQMDISNFFSQTINWLNNFIWGDYLVVLLLLVGLFFSFILFFPQLSLIKDAIKVITEKDPSARGNKQHISPYEALMISMGTRIGMGTIVGMAVAVIAGGPGAIVWLWLAAFLNAAICVAENTLGQVYKSRDGNGFKGGAAFYITKGLGNKKIAIIYSCVWLFVQASFTSLYSNTIYSSIEGYFSFINLDSLSVYIGLILALYALIMFFGGGRYIARFASYVTPFMVMLFIIISIISIFMNLGKTPEVISSIFYSAFDFRAIFSGFAGSVIVIGIQRGLFSNEAGLGDVPATSSSAHTSHPVKQGIAQAFCVLTDTIVATLAMLFILYSDTYSKLIASLMPGEKAQISDATPLVQSAMNDSFGKIGEYYVTFLIIILTATVIIGGYYVGMMNIKYIKDNPKVLFLYRIFMVLIVYAGAQISVSLAWDLANVAMGIAATINLISIFFLYKIVKIVLNDYKNQKKQGLDPTFSAKKLGIKNAECWD